MRDAVLVSETPHCGSGVVYKNSVLLLYSVVSDLSFKDAILLAAIISCCYRNGIEKDQWRKNSKTTLCSYTWQRGESKRHHTAPQRSSLWPDLARLLKDSGLRRILHNELHYHEFLDLINGNYDIPNTLLVLWISRIVTTGLQTTRVNFTTCFA